MRKAAKRAASLALAASMVMGSAFASMAADFTCKSGGVEFKPQPSGTASYSTFSGEAKTAAVYVVPMDTELKLGNVQAVDYMGRHRVMSTQGEYNEATMQYEVVLDSNFYEDGVFTAINSALECYNVMVSADGENWLFCLRDGAPVTNAAVTQAETLVPAKRTDGFWAQNETGWWIQYPDGTYMTNDWYQDPGSGLWYYMGADGYMMTNTTTPDGCQLDANGVWIQ